MEMEPRPGLQGHSELISKLGHPLCSYRLRALQSLKFKLDYCLLTVVDLSADSLLISGLLECLGRNVNENADEVSDSGRQDSSRDQEEEVALSLTLLEVLSKDIMAARTMYDSGALPVLGALKRAPRFRVLAHQRVPAILENISAAIKTALVMPAVGVMACADQVLHDSTHTAVQQRQPPDKARTQPATTSSQSPSLTRAFLDLALMLASSDVTVVRQACHCLCSLLPNAPALTVLKSSSLLQALQRRLSVHGNIGSQVLLATDIRQLLLKTCTCLLDSLRSDVRFQCSPFTSPACPWPAGSKANGEFISLSLDLVLSLLQTVIPLGLVNHQVSPLVSSVVMATIAYLSTVKLRLAPSLPLLPVKSKETLDVLEMLCRCIRHLCKESCRSDRDDEHSLPGTGSKSQVFNITLICALNKLLDLFSPSFTSLSATTRDVIDQLVLDVSLNVTHPNVIAGLAVHASYAVMQVWQDMRHFAHSIAASHAFSGMTMEELQVDDAMSLRLAHLCLPCLAFLDKTECSEVVAQLCKFLAPRVRTGSLAAQVLLSLLAYSSAGVRQSTYACLVSLWQEQLLTIRAPTSGSEDSKTQLFLLQPDVICQISLFGLFDSSLPVVQNSATLICAILQSPGLCRDLGLSPVWLDCCLQCLPSIQAYVGNNKKIDTAIMSLLTTRTTDCAADDHGLSECACIQGLFRWMFAKDAKLRVWALSQLMKHLLEEDSSLINPFDRAPDSSIADLLLVPTPISLGEVSNSVTLHRVKELLEIIKNTRLDVSLQVAAAQQLLLAVRGISEKHIRDFAVQDIVAVLRRCMTKSDETTDRTGTAAPSLLSLLEPCVGVIAFAVERSPGIRQACCEDVTVCLTILRACLLVPHNKTLRSYVCRLVLHIAFRDCSSDVQLKGVKFVSSTLPSSAASQACFWQHIMERFVIKASFVSSSVCSSHGPAPLQLSDSRPDLYSMTELHLLCNEWVECTASQTADNQAACDSLLTQLVAALKSSPDSTLSKLPMLHMSSAFVAEVSNIQAARDHSSVQSALQQIQVILAAVSAISTCPVPEGFSSLFPRCIAACNIASVDGRLIFEAVGRFLSIQPNSADDMEVFLQLIETLCKVVSSAEVSHADELLVMLADATLLPESVLSAVVLRLCALCAPLDQQQRQWQDTPQLVDSLSSVLDFYATLLGRLPAARVSRYALSVLTSLNAALACAMKNGMGASCHVSADECVPAPATCLQCWVLECIVNVSALLDFEDLATSGRQSGLDFSIVYSLLIPLVQITRHEVECANDSQSAGRKYVLRPAVVSLAQLSGWLNAQSAKQNWRQIYSSEVKTSVLSPSSVLWMKPLLLTSDPTLYWSGLHCISSMISDRGMLAQVISLCTFHSHNIWGLAMDSLCNASLCSLVRKQAGLLLVKLMSRPCVESLAIVCKQMPETRRVQNMSTVPGLMAWLSSRSVRFYSWLHDTFASVLELPSSPASLDSSSGDALVSDVSSQGTAWISCLCPLVHNLIALCSLPVVELLLQHGVIADLVSIISMSSLGEALRLACCQVLSTASSVSSPLRHWLVSGEQPLRQLIYCLGHATPVPVTCMVATILQRFFPSSQATNRAANVASDLLCQSWHTFGGWCQRLLTSGNTQHMSTVVKLLTTLLGQVHMDHRQSPSATPALLVQLDLTDGCSQSLASQESSESRHICSACLCSYLVEAFEGDSEATHIFNSRPPAAAHSLLTSLLAVSVEARKHAVKAGFCKSLHSYLASCVQQFSVLALKVNLSSSERRKLELNIVSHCIPALQLLQNVILQDREAKLSLVELNVAALLHRLWCWALQHESLLQAALGFMISFTAACTQASQSLLMSSPDRTSVPRPTSGPQPKSLIHFMCHRVSHLLSLMSSHSVTAVTNSTSALAGQDLSLLMLCSLLAAVARVTPCRRVLIKEGLLSRFAPSGRLPIKNLVLLHSLLQLCLAMSFSADGIAHLLKLSGIIDWLCDVGMSSRRLDFPVAATYQYVCSQPLTSRKATLSAALVLRNIGVEHKRVLHTSSRPREVFSMLSSTGTDQEKKVAIDAMSVFKVGAL